MLLIWCFSFCLLSRRIIQLSEFNRRVEYLKADSDFEFCNEYEVLILLAFYVVCRNSFRDHSCVLAHVLFVSL